MDVYSALMKKIIYVISTIIFTLYVLTHIQPACAQVGLFIRPNSSSLSSPVSGQTWLFNSTNNTVSVYNGSIFQLAGQAQGNFAASSNPTTANDNTEGYSTGSVWYNTSNSNLYICTSAATSAAVWVLTNNLGNNAIPLTQLQTTGASTGQSIVFNGTHWAVGSPTINASQILQSGASTGQVLTWNGSNYVPAIAGAFTNITLSQILQSGATTGQVVTWNGTAWVAQAASALPSYVGLAQFNVLYINGLGAPTWMSNSVGPNGPGSFVYVNAVPEPAWSNGASNIGYINAFPYTPNGGGTVSWSCGFIGVANDAGSPITTSTYALTNTSLVTFDPDVPGGITVDLPFVNIEQAGLVYCLKNVGTTDNLTVTCTVSGQYFNSPSGPTTITVTPGQCLNIACQPYGGRCVWVVISQM